MMKPLFRTRTASLLIAFLGLCVSAFASETLKPIAGGIDPTHFERALVPGSRPPFFHIGLSLKNIKQKEAEAFVNSLSDPNSPNFHHFISQTEYGQRFGAPQADIDSVVAYLKSKGILKIDVTENRLFVRAEASEPQLQAAFHVNIVDFVRPNAAQSGLSPTFFAPSDTPLVPSDIAARVTAVHGLTDYFQARPGVTRTQPTP